MSMGEFAYNTTLVPVDDLSPGDYTITTAVYAWQTGERLPVNGSDSALLGQFTVP